MERKNTEIIAFASGKGGTGKTSLTSALGYALTRCGFEVLLIDADPATDGFSLFILGPTGMRRIASYKPENTFTGFLEAFSRGPEAKVVPASVNRLDSDDHGLLYKTAIISGKGLYGSIPVEQQLGDTKAPIASVAVGKPETNAINLDRATFRAAITAMFEQMRGKFDYILVDTRGGFSFESTDVCAIADSFIIVTEANYTSYFQDKNLIQRISEAATELKTKTVLRAIIVNKATQGEEESFRSALVEAFGIRMEDTFPVALDFDALKAYKTQQVVYKKAPASQFAYDSIRAFSEILRVVTAQWPEERVREWNKLVEEIKAAIAAHNKKVTDEEERVKQTVKKFEVTEAENHRLKSDLESAKALLEQSKISANELLEALKKQNAQAEAALAKERAEAESRARDRQEELNRAKQELAERIELTASKRSKEVELEFSKHKAAAEKSALVYQLLAGGAALAAIALGVILVFNRPTKKSGVTWGGEYAETLATFQARNAKSSDGALGKAIAGVDLAIDGWQDAMQQNSIDYAKQMGDIAATFKETAADLDRIGSGLRSVRELAGKDEKAQLIINDIEKGLKTIPPNLAGKERAIWETLRNFDNAQRKQRGALETYQKIMRTKLEEVREGGRSSFTALEAGMRLQKQIFEASPGQEQNLQNQREMAEKEAKNAVIKFDEIVSGLKLPEAPKTSTLQPNQSRNSKE